MTMLILLCRISSQSHDALLSPKNSFRGTVIIKTMLLWSVLGGIPPEQ